MSKSEYQTDRQTDSHMRVISLLPPPLHPSPSLKSSRSHLDPMSLSPTLLFDSRRKIAMSALHSVRGEGKGREGLDRVRRGRMGWDGVEMGCGVMGKIMKIKAAWSFVG